MRLCPCAFDPLSGRRVLCRSCELREQRRREAKRINNGCRRPPRLLIDQPRLLLRGGS